MKTKLEYYSVEKLLEDFSENVYKNFVASTAKKRKGTFMIDESPSGWIDYKKQLPITYLDWRIVI